MPLFCLPAIILGLQKYNVHYSKGATVMNFLIKRNIPALCMNRLKKLIALYSDISIEVQK